MGLRIKPFNSVPIPVVIAHVGGAPSYLKHSLESAARFNRDVVLIGDESNQGIWRNHWNRDGVESTKYKAFLDSYTKLSDYPDAYEQAFWERPFMVEAWMRAERVEELFLLDSDVLTFADYSREVVPVLPDNCQATLIMPAGDQEIGQLWSSLHFSYWKREALDDFNTFIVNAYRDREMRSRLEAKYRWHIDHHQPGGVCEMTLLYYWARNNNGKVSNLAEVIGGSVADLAVTQSNNYFDNEYGMHRGFKRLVFRNGVPFGFNQVLRKEVRFWCLHCQGNAKGAMHLLRRPGLRAFFPDLYRIAQLQKAR
jgi:hypothetical protein